MDNGIIQPLLRCQASIKNMVGSLELYTTELAFHTDSKSAHFQFVNYKFPFKITPDDYEFTLISLKDQSLKVKILQEDTNEAVNKKSFKEFVLKLEKTMVSFSVVKNPKRCEKDGHISYLVEYMDVQKQCVYKVYHRYSDFESFYVKLQHTFPGKVIPTLPGKNIMPLKKEPFILERCKQLDTFMKELLRNRAYAQSKELEEFLSKEEGSYKSVPSGYFSKMMNIISSKPQEDQNFSLESDYKEIRSMLAANNVEPKKLPFGKFLVLLLGTTSTGKSAYVNHIFGISCKKSAEHQQDTGFSFIEAIPLEAFAKLSKHPLEKFSEYQFTQSELQKPIEDMDSDYRNGIVFIKLKGKQAVAYYDQIRHHETDGLFEVILVNQKYLSPNHPNYQLASRMILIDSPGFDSINIMDIPDKFMGNLRILQYLYNLCDSLLYFIPCGQISTVANQLFFLELAVIYALSDKSKVEETIQKYISETQEKKPETSHRDNKASISFDIPSFSNVLMSGLGLPSGIMDLLDFSISPSVDHEEMDFKGTSVWHKTMFVLSKVDTILSNKPKENQARIIHAQYYELGVLLGKSLRILHPPVMDHCVMIGLPEHQKDDEIIVADLISLNRRLKKRDEQTPYLQRMESSIQNMCNELKKNIDRSWARIIYLNMIGKIDAIYARSVERMKQL